MEHPRKADGGTDTVRVSYFRSIKAKVAVIVLISVAVAFFLVESILLNQSEKELKEVNQNYLYDVAVQSGIRLDEQIATHGFKESITYDNLSAIFSGVGIKGMNSSYVYVVAADSTMLYHPRKEKVGEPVENEVVKGVSLGLSTGAHYEPEFVQYVFDDAQKYAAFYVTKDEQVIVVATVDESEILSPLKRLARVSTIIGFAIILAACLAGYIISSFFSRPIKKVTKVIGKISDLDFREMDDLSLLSKRHDETGVMAKAVNRMQKQMSGVIGTLKEQGNSVTEASDQLNKVSKETAKTIGQIEKAVCEIADGSTYQAEETQKATESVILMGNMVEETISLINKLAVSSNESVKLIDKLMESPENNPENHGVETTEIISKVKTGIEGTIKGINRIADKTKRLDDARIAVVDAVQNLTAIAEENAASTQQTSEGVSQVATIVYNISENANRLDEVSNELKEQVSLFTV
ncbi:MAG: methyl-accepting chemotaxis protein [Lachnospiraceae bacterium]|jgi:methyl-accepting chemotaxis protein|nr:methyl-accepting chemotaxis protein [Lachnospiraceae bacterium]